MHYQVNIQVHGASCVAEVPAVPWFRAAAATLEDVKRKVEAELPEIIDQMMRDHEPMQFPTGYDYKVIEAVGDSPIAP